MANTHTQTRASIDLGAGLANPTFSGDRNKIVRNHPPRLQHSPSLPNIWSVVSDSHTTKFDAFRYPGSHPTQAPSLLRLKNLIAICFSVQLLHRPLQHTNPPCHPLHLLKKSWNIARRFLSTTLLVTSKRSPSKFRCAVGLTGIMGTLYLPLLSRLLRV